MIESPTIPQTGVETPPVAHRANGGGPGGPAYIIAGCPRAGRFWVLDEATAEAAALMDKLRLLQPVKVREAGSDRVAATVRRAVDGSIEVVG